MRFSSLPPMLCAAAVLLAPATPQAAVLMSEGFDKDYKQLSGKDNWTSRYCQDAWTTERNGGVSPYTDNGCTCGNQCYYGVFNGPCNDQPVNNFLVRGDAGWTDYRYEATFRNQDNDTFGFVFRYSNTLNHYAVQFTRDVGVYLPGACDGTGIGSRLIAMKGNQQATITVLGESSKTYTVGKTHRIRVIAKGSLLTVWFDANADGVIDEVNEKLFQVNDSTHSKGMVGLYAYQSGLADAACQSGDCWFDDLQVTTLDPPAPDQDGDGTPDATDNCTGVANPDQANHDADKWGDACDLDADNDGLANPDEVAMGLNPLDADSDDDGLLDGAEPNPGGDADGDGLKNAPDPDADNDQLPDGLEAGVLAAGPDTDLAKGKFLGDKDPNSKTNPQVADTDGDGTLDGFEDLNKNGTVDSCEQNPVIPDTPPCVADVTPDVPPDADTVIAPDAPPADLDGTVAPDVTGVDVPAIGDSTVGDSTVGDGIGDAGVPDGPLVLDVASQGDAEGCSASRHSAPSGGWAVSLAFLVLAVAFRRRRA
jgi:MYXO-CTERM domain-containing protein